jgi:hypothetical protein
MPDSAWLQAILNALALKPDALLTLALDPDDLLLEPEVRAALESEEPPVHLLTLDPADPIMFRYMYESGYRSRWDAGEPVRLLARLAGNDPKTFPYDLLARAGGMRSVRNLALYTFFPIWPIRSCRNWPTTIGLPWPRSTMPIWPIPRRSG